MAETSKPSNQQSESTTHPRKPPYMHAQAQPNHTQLPSETRTKREEGKNYGHGSIAEESIQRRAESWQGNRGREENRGRESPCIPAERIAGARRGSREEGGRQNLLWGGTQRQYRHFLFVLALSQCFFIKNIHLNILGELITLLLRLFIRQII